MRKLKILINVLIKCYKINYIKIKYKKRVLFSGDVSIDLFSRIAANKGLIHLGNKICVKSNKKNHHCGMPFYSTIFVDVDDAIIKIGDYTRINGAYIHGQKSIIIGKNCLIAAGVNILDSNGHSIFPENRIHSRDIPGTIFIGDNVWIGLNATILKNTYIGDNSVISAGSVVQGRFPNNSLIQGNPAVKKGVL